MEKWEDVLLKVCRKAKIEELVTFDKQYTPEHIVIGVDEAGRGPVAGPVTASAVYIEEFSDDILEALKYLDDSKKFSSNPKLRKELSDEIKKCSIYSICSCSVEEIDKLNILQASLLAMKKAVNELKGQLCENKNVLVLVDGKIPIKELPFAQQPLVKGDSKSASIAAASILAKVHRDDFMTELAEEFPIYEWQQNKGYPTKKHIALIREHNACIWHRQSFLKKILNQQLSLFSLILIFTFLRIY